MFCPLLWIAKPEVEIGLSSEHDCLKEGCAWWDKDKDMCFRASETMELRFIRSILLEIRDKMPHALRFRQ